MSYNQDPVINTIHKLINEGDEKAKELYLRYHASREYGDSDMSYCRLESYIEELEEEE